ncbi:hypothetical protein GQ53DRAFT_753979 [Thozetella sp. PMI_491]|nr:hypothetical protein GQ53DRAFT_753979 [Thozetella sp. PMI_491]
MIRLHQFPEEHHGLDLSLCGILFMSTPHSGAIAADWNDYLVEVASHGGLRARDMTRLLGAFNNESRRSKELFGRIRPLPPFICLYETRKTQVAGLAKLVGPTSHLCLVLPTCPPLL